MLKNLFWNAFPKLISLVSRQIRQRDDTVLQIIEFRAGQYEHLKLTSSLLTTLQIRSLMNISYFFHFLHPYSVSKTIDKVTWKCQLIFYSSFTVFQFHVIVSLRRTLHTISTEYDTRISVNS